MGALWAQKHEHAISSGSSATNMQGTSQHATKSSIRASDAPVSAHTTAAKHEEPSIPRRWHGLSSLLGHDSRDRQQAQPHASMGHHGRYQTPAVPPLAALSSSAPNICDSASDAGLPEARATAGGGTQVAGGFLHRMLHRRSWFAGLFATPHGSSHGGKAAVISGSPRDNECTAEPVVRALLMLLLVRGRQGACSSNPTSMHGSGRQYRHTITAIQVPT